jgi:hypothetical protein
MADAKENKVGTRLGKLVTSHKTPGLPKGTFTSNSKPTSIPPTIFNLFATTSSPAAAAAAAASSSPPLRKSSIDTSISSPSVQAALSVNVDRITNENLSDVAQRINADSNYKPKLYELCLAIRALSELMEEVNSNNGLIEQRKEYLKNRLRFIKTIFENYKLFEEDLTSDGKPILNKNVQKVVSAIFGKEYKISSIPIAISTLLNWIEYAPTPNAFEYAKQWWRYILQDIVVNDVIPNPDYEFMYQDVNYAKLENQLKNEDTLAYIKFHFGHYPVKDIKPEQRLSFQTGTLETQQFELIQEHLKLIEELTTIRKDVKDASVRISELLQQNTEFAKLNKPFQDEIVFQVDEIFTDESTRNENNVDEALKQKYKKPPPTRGGRRKKTQRRLRKHPRVKSMKPKKNIYCRKTKSVYKKRETKKR